MKNKEESHREEIIRLQSGDLDTFRIIFNREVPLLRAFAGKFVDASVAQDLVQDVFLKVWTNRNLFPINDSIRAYLFRAVRNRCLNYLESQKIQEPLYNQPFIEEQIREVLFFQSPEQIFIEKEELDSILQAIESLPEKSRLVFKLAYQENKKAAEIAEILQLSVRTVETQIYKSLKLLRTKF